MEVPLTKRNVVLGLAVISVFCVLPVCWITVSILQDEPSGDVVVTEAVQERTVARPVATDTIIPTVTFTMTVKPTATITPTRTPRPTSTPKPTRTPTPTLSVDGYREVMLLGLYYLSEGVDYQSELATMASEMPALVFSETWQKEMNNALSWQRRGAKIIADTTPPNELKEVHDVILLALDERNLMEKDVKEFMDSGDINYISDAAEHMKKMTELLTQAVDMMP